MEISIIDLWKTQNEKIDQALNINKLLLKDSLEHKVKSALSRFRSIRWSGIIFGILWCVGVCFLLISTWTISNWFFRSAVIIHLLVTLIAIGLYIYHLVLIQKIDNNKTVVEAQKTFIMLRQSNLKTLGLLWVQLPVFSMWYMSLHWMYESPITFWFIQIPLVVFQFIIGIWFYLNLNYKNIDKKWFKWLMSKGEFAEISKTIELMKELESLY